MDVRDRVSVGQVLSQRGELTVLVPKTSEHRPGFDLPWEILPNAFKNDFPDFNLHLQTLERSDFTQQVSLRPQGEMKGREVGRNSPGDLLVGEGSLAPFAQLFSGRRRAMEETEKWMSQMIYCHDRERSQVVSDE